MGVVLPRLKHGRAIIKASTKLQRRIEQRYDTHANRDTATRLPGDYESESAIVSYKKNYFQPSFFILGQSCQT